MKNGMIKKIIFFLILPLLLSTAVFGAQKESIEEFSGTDSLWEMIPEEVDRKEISALFEERGETGFLKQVLQEIYSAFGLGISKGVELFLMLCGLLLISALFRSVKDSFQLGGMESAFDFLLFLAISMTAFSALQGGIDVVSGALSAIHSFFLASLPVTTLLLTMSGAGGSAATLGANLSFVLGLVSTLVNTYLAPLLRTLFAFSLIDGISDCSLKGLIAFLKKSVKVLCVLFFTLVSATLSLQNALATAADSLAMRSVRFAAGNFIPVVGSLVGESTRTLSAAFRVVKSECGMLCVLILFYVIIRPILYLAVQKIFLSLAGAVGEILGEAKCKAHFASLSSLLDLLMALMISEGCYLVFYITLFLNNRGSF